MKDLAAVGLLLAASAVLATYQSGPISRALHDRSPYGLQANELLGQPAEVITTRLDSRSSERTDGSDGELLVALPSPDFPFVIVPSDD